ncbi:MAG: hypothetical protein L0214_15425, partial [candidate division NC10 bacterium]|nr:hypothetical protein [candidate division NC10 bacterium]
KSAEDAFGAAAQRLEGLIAGMQPEDPTFWDKLAQGVGSFSTFLVPGLTVHAAAAKLASTAPGLAAWLGPAVMTFLEAASEGGGSYRELTQRGMDPGEASKEAGKVIAKNVALLAATNKLGLFSKDPNRLRRGFKAGGLEGFQEGEQYDISREPTGDPYSAKEYWESVGVGAALGGPAGAITAPRRQMPGRAVPAEQPATPAATVAPPVPTPPPTPTQRAPGATQRPAPIEPPPSPIVQRAEEAVARAEELIERAEEVAALPPGDVSPGTQPPSQTAPVTVEADLREPPVPRQTAEERVGPRVLPDDAGRMERIEERIPGRPIQLGPSAAAQREELNPGDPLSIARWVKARGGISLEPNSDLAGEYATISSGYKNRRGSSVEAMAEAISEATGQPFSDADLLTALNRISQARDLGRQRPTEAISEEAAAEREAEQRDLAALPEEEKVRRIAA